MLFLAIAFAATSTTVASQGSMSLETGGGLLFECRTDGGSRRNSNFVEGLCYGLLVGYDNYHNLFGGTVYCRPAITRMQMVAVFLKFLQDNPEEWHQSSTTLFLVAMGRAYPCAE